MLLKPCTDEQKEKETAPANSVESGDGLPHLAAPALYLARFEIQGMPGPGATSEISGTVSLFALPSCLSIWCHHDLRRWP